MVRDIGIAEELAQDALGAALEQWPAEGIPRNPGESHRLRAPLRIRQDLPGLRHHAGSCCEHRGSRDPETHLRPYARRAER